LSVVKPATHLATKIPDQTRCIEVIGREIHFRLQVWLGLTKQGCGWEVRRDEWKADERNGEADRGGGNCDAAKEAHCGPAFEPMSRKQQREERKGRQGVVKQFGLHEREDNKNNRAAGEKIDIEKVAFLPKPSGKPRNVY